ncbi:MAG: glutamate--cysteine ligase [Egibacteraceae bacterium]
MGREITAAEFTREDCSRYRRRLKRCLRVLGQVVDSGLLERGQRLVGVEMEVHLADREGIALPVNSQVLQRLDSGMFQPELARFNVEFSIAPRELRGDCLRWMERELNLRLRQTQEAAEALGGQTIVIGILPTFATRDAVEENFSARIRYRALNDAILAARGENLDIRIHGVESLCVVARSILFEAACTGLHLHAQVDAEDSARYWNAAQALSAPLVAVAANSPFFLQRQLHHETRIALFLQSIDTRPEELVHQGVRPRVWFGEAWLRKSVFELFEENVRFFPPLLPVCDDEDPDAVLAGGRTPALDALTLHNGTIYRWNRPVYEVTNGTGHLRIENRVLPAGPSIADSVANAALYFGLLRALMNAERPVWEEMSFKAADRNFFTAAKHGLGARLHWPRVGSGVPVGQLLLRHLIPLAHDGLRDWSIDVEDADYYLGIIEARASTGRNGAVWQIATHRALVEHDGLDRSKAARELVRRYAECFQSGAPVHTWPVGPA